MGERIRKALTILASAGPATFAPWMIPPLRNLSYGLTYRDADGAEHGGQALEIGFPEQRAPAPGARRRRPWRYYRLRLVLDDKVNPLERGYFQPEDGRGRIGLTIRPPRQTPGAAASQQGLESQSDDELARVLHHEVIHMFAYWNRVVPQEYLPFTESQRATLGLGLVRGWIPRIETNLAAIFADVNRARRAARPQRRPVPDASRHDFALRLAEEAMVRGETQFMSAMQGQIPTARTGLPEIRGAVARAPIEDYLFEAGDMLLPSDRAALSDQGRTALERIKLIFDAMVEDQLRQRWGPTL